jgi:hypothetical protein
MFLVIKTNYFLTVGNKARRYNRKNLQGVDQLKITMTFIDQEKIKRLNDIKTAENEFRHIESISQGKKANN